MFYILFQDEHEFWALQFFTDIQKAINHPAALKYIYYDLPTALTAQRQQVTDQIENLALSPAV